MHLSRYSYAREISGYDTLEEHYNIFKRYQLLETEELRNEMLKKLAKKFPDEL